MGSENFDRYSSIQADVPGAIYLAPIPPAPSGDCISYGPSFVPDVRAMGRHYMAFVMTRQPDLIPDGLSAASNLSSNGAAAGPGKARYRKLIH
jgi:hypothetical protein